MKRFVALVVVLGFTVSAQAASPTASDSFEYPELLVTPKASERIEMEAKRETERRWATHLPLAIPGLMTFTAGLIQSGYVDTNQDVDKRSPMAGIVVGGGWLATSLILTLSSTPYGDAHTELQGMAKGTKREQLLRERMAEEALLRPARLASRLKWLSVLTNAAAATYMIAKAENGSFGRLVDGAALLVAFTPLIFKHSWQDAYTQQDAYKKRIYGPVASAGWTVAHVGGKAAPAFAFSLQF